MKSKRLKTVREVFLAGKRVLLRPGWDVPLKKSKVKSQKSKVVVDDDTRIKETLPTIQYLFDHDIAHLTIMFHVGRPGGKVVPEMSVKPVAQRFQDLAGDSIDLAKVSILENLRFDRREEENDDGFARELAENQDIYINDGFSNCHRRHASMAAITKFLPAYAGLSVEKEVANLLYLLDKPARPFVVLIGGKKVEDKIGVIERMSKVADTVLVGGKTGIELKKSPIPNLKSKNVTQLVDDVDGLDIGPKTIALFKRELAKAKTVFWNGNMGKSEESKYARGTFEMAKFIASLNAKKYIGGGDTSKVIEDLNLTDKMTYVSTGGGASLEFLAQNGDLPGLRPLYLYN